MRAYMTNEYKQNLIGNTFISSDSSEKEYDGLKVVEIIRELTEKDYDRELIDGTDKNKKGEAGILSIPCMKYALKITKSSQYTRMKLIRIIVEAGDWKKAKYCLSLQTRNAV